MWIKKNRIQNRKTRNKDSNIAVDMSNDKATKQTKSFNSYLDTILVVSRRKKRFLVVFPYFTLNMAFIVFFLFLNQTFCFEFEKGWCKETSNITNIFVNFIRIIGNIEKETIPKHQQLHYFLLQLISIECWCCWFADDFSCFFILFLYGCFNKLFLIQ